MPKGDRRPVLGTGARMNELEDQVVDLIVTSPPYFPATIEDRLRAPRKAQNEDVEVTAAIVRYALTLRPVFAECVRVLKPSGVLVMQTKDIRYGGALLPLASAHRDLVLSCGLRLISRVFWQRTIGPQKHGARAADLNRGRHVGSFVASDVEEFLVFASSNGPRVGGLTEMDDEELLAIREPLWRTPGPGGKGNHPYRSPAVVVRRFIRLFSEPGDLVIDPFAGSGTTLRVAAALNRRTMGWDIDPRWGSLSDLDALAHSGDAQP